MSDLWPEDIQSVKAVAPVTIVREQGATLGKKTKNLVIGEVEEIAASERGRFAFRFAITAPALKYEYDLFSFQYGVDLYPVDVYPDRVNWFFSDQDEHTVKSLDELMGMYYYSVGRGCNLLVNIGPDRRGLLPDKDAARLVELGTEIQRRLGHPIATLENVVADGYMEYKSQSPMLIDHIVIQEDLATGERARKFAIKVIPAPSGMESITIHEGCNIGHKAICRFPLIKVLKVRLEFIESDGPVKIRSMQFHNSLAER